MRLLTIWTLVGTIALWAVGAAEADAVETISGACVGMLSIVYIWGSCLSYPLNCVCSNTNFTQTVVGCVDMLLKDVDPAEVEERRTLAFGGVILQCPNVTMTELEGYSESVPSLEPLGCVSKKGALCPADRAFLPEEGEVQDALKAYTWSYVDAYKTCWRYGGASLAYWGGVILIRAVIYWGLRLFPGTSQRIGKSSIVTFTRRYLTLPPMLSRYHSQPYSIFKFVTLNLPTREQSVIVTGFLGLCLGLNFGYKMYNPTYVFEYVESESYCYYIGLISGYLILFHLPLLIVFAGRNNFLLPITGWSQDTFVVFHKWVGRIIMVEVIIHTVVFTVYFVEVHYFTISWADAYWNWGVVALFFGCLILVQGMDMFRKMGYETFLILHIICAVFFIVGSYYHVKLLEGFIQFIWASAAVWAFERAVRIVRVLVANPFATALIESHNDSVLEYTINYSKAWKFKAGQYIYIHLLSPSCFWESHPFSVMAPVKEEDNGTLKLFVRAKDGTTRKTLKKAIAKGGAFNAHVWIDGPYGHRYNLESYSEAVLIAGGLGITAVFAYVQGLIRMNAQTGISLYWAVSSDDALIWFKDQIDYMTTNNVNLHIYVTNGVQSNNGLIDPSAAVTSAARTTLSTSSSERSGSDPSENDMTKSQLVVTGSAMPDESSLSSHVSYERLAVGPTIQEHIVQSKGSVVVLSCGPGSMNDDARTAVTSELTSTDNFVEYIEESYSW